MYRTDGLAALIFCFVAFTAAPDHFAGTGFKTLAHMVRPQYCYRIAAAASFHSPDVRPVVGLRLRPLP